MLRWVYFKIFRGFSAFLAFRPKPITLSRASGVGNTINYHYCTAGSWVGRWLFVMISFQEGETSFGISWEPLGEQRG